MPATERARIDLEAMSRLGALFDYTPAFLLRVVSKLGVADHMSREPIRVEELAEVTGANAPSLERALRSLSFHGVFEEPTPGQFALTSMGELLKTDHPLTMVEAFRLHPDVDVLIELEHSIRTGEAVFERVFGMEYWEYLAEHPELLEEFHGTMRTLTGLESLTVLRLYKWASVRTLVDVGGNDGTFLSIVLKRFPHMRGVLFDLPETVERAPETLARAGVADRVDIVPGNAFTTPVPEGADTYMIKRVLVEFDDDRAVEFLRNVRQAMRPDSRVLIMEPMFFEGDRVGPSLDALILVVGRGRIRTPDEFGKVLARAGFEHTRIIPAGLTTIVEGRPA